MEASYCLVEAVTGFFNSFLRQDRIIYALIMHRVSDFQNKE